MDICGKKINWMINQEVNIMRNNNILMLNIQAISFQEDNVILKGVKYLVDIHFKQYKSYRYHFLP